MAFSSALAANGAAEIAATRAIFFQAFHSYLLNKLILLLSEFLVLGVEFVAPQFHLRLFYSLSP
jgi:hypothetical protein